MAFIYRAVTKFFGAKNRSRLLELPDEVLEVVLGCCAANDLFSLLSAARAHSQLHQAAKKVTSIRAVLPNQQKMDGLLDYLKKHRQDLQELDSIDIAASRSSSSMGRYHIFLYDLPHKKLQKLRSLSFSNYFLQLRPGAGIQGVLGLTTDLTQLQLNSCKLCENGAGLAAALAQLTNPKHLTISEVCLLLHGRSFHVPSLPLLQHLTHLELSGDKLQDADGLRHLEGATGLKHLRLIGLGATIRASYLSGLQDLTYLEVMPKGVTAQELHFCTSTATSGVFEPGALAGMTQLLFVNLLNISIPGGTAGVAEVLSHSQHVMRLKSLTIEDLSFSKPSTQMPRNQQQAITPAAPLVTLSSKLQRVHIIGLSVPADTSVWEFVFPFGRQFPHLQELEFSLPWSDGGSRHAARLGTSSLVSCCPRLQSLETPEFEYSAAELALLSELRSLRELSMIPDSSAWDTVCQMSRLTSLGVRVPFGMEKERLELLQQLTQLKQLIALDFQGGGAESTNCQFVAGPAGTGLGDGPISQQVMLHISGKAELLQQLAWPEESGATPRKWDFPERPIPSAKLPKFLIKGGPGTGGPLLTGPTGKGPIPQQVLRCISGSEDRLKQGTQEVPSLHCRRPAHGVCRADVLLCGYLHSGSDDSGSDSGESDDDGMPAPRR